METTTGTVVVLVTIMTLSTAACAPPTPKVEQRPASVPHHIAPGPQEPVREMDPSFRPLARKGSLRAAAQHG